MVSWLIHRYVLLYWVNWDGIQNIQVEPKKVAKIVGLTMIDSKIFWEDSSAETRKQEKKSKK